VIALFLRREARYTEAIQVVRGLKGQYLTISFLPGGANLRKDAGEGMVAVTAYRELIAHSARPGYFAEARLEIGLLRLGRRAAGQRHYERQRGLRTGCLSKNVGPELKIRSLLAAGECHT